MINAVDIEVYGGYYEIVQGMDFGVSSSAAEFVTYEHEGVWYVRGDKCRGRSAQTLIILPDNAQLARFSLTVSDGAFKIDTLSADAVIINANNSSGEVRLGSVGALRLDVGKGTLRANVRDCEKCKVECGKGQVDLTLGKTDGGYCIKSRHGIGNVTHNCISLPRQFHSDDGHVPVNIVCGMGNVNLYT